MISAHALVPLRHAARVLVSNVDKKSTDGDRVIRLVNYTDVYHRDRITSDMPLMMATATDEQYVRFRVLAGDSVITKDSETAADIAVPTHVSSVDEQMVCGYHLAIVRPGRGTDARYLTWALRSDFVRGQFAVAANGMTRYGLTYDAIESARIPLPSEAGQRRIADFLDDQVARIDNIIAARANQLALAAQSMTTSLDTLFDGPPRPLKSMLAQSPCYGVLVPKFRDVGVPFIRVNDLARLGNRHELPFIDVAQSAEYQRSVVETGDVLVSVVGSLDKSAIVTRDTAGANIARAVARLRPATVPSTVLHGWLSTTSYRDQARLATGSDTAQPTLNMGDLSGFRCGLPECDLAALADRITDIRDATHRAIVWLSDSIQLVQELKRSLITAAVTGEFDVSTANGSGIPV